MAVLGVAVESNGFTLEAKFCLFNDHSLYLSSTCNISAYPIHQTLVSEAKHFLAIRRKIRPKLVPSTFSGDLA